MRKSSPRFVMGKIFALIFIKSLCFNHAFGASIFNSQLNYAEVRESVIAAEQSMRTGGSIYLNPKEEMADKILLKMKEKAILRGIEDPASFSPSMHFFRAKQLIDKDPIFEIIKRFPKGGLLHVHNTAAVSSEWIIKNLTYSSEIKICNGSSGLMFHVLPSKFCESELIPVIKLRAAARNVTEFDNELEKLINLHTDQPEIDYPNTNTVWSKFQNNFHTIGGILDYLPVFKIFHWRLLEELYDDNVFYMEMRTGLGSVFDENGKKLDSEEIVEVLISLVDDFKKSHKSFLGLKIIMSIPRNSEKASAEAKMKKFADLNLKYPNFVVGFDLVGQEDKGTPLSAYVQKLKEISQNGRFYFHAGETNWFNTEADANLIDAILMNTKRIGHGYSLYKHPVLWAAFKDKDIAIEVSPISNQVLHLVSDLRNHPATFYISENIPIVISNDDPGFWNAKGLSYDFYYALMAFAPADTALQILKQLAWNSIKYSAMTVAERKYAAITFKSAWDKFIDYLLTYEELKS